MEKFDNTADASQAAKLAFGRILRMSARPAQSGDVQEYERCKTIMLDAFDFLSVTATDTRPNFVRDYYKMQDQR